MPQPENDVSSKSVCATRWRAAGATMPVNRQWPAFDVRTRQGCLLPSKRQRVGGELFAPERLFEPLAAAVGAGRCNRRRSSWPSRAHGHLGRGAPGGVDVALHFAQRDRCLGQRAVGVEHGIERILPALRDQALSSTGGNTRRTRRRRSRRSVRSMQCGSMCGQIDRMNARSPVRR